MLCVRSELGRVVILCALAGCAGGGLADEPGPGVVTETDVEVFQLVFGDVSRWRFPYNGRLLFAGEGDEVLVSPTTPGFPPFVPDDEWKGSDYRTWPGIGDLAASMCVRNAILAQLPFFAFEGGEIREFGRMRTGEFMHQDPDPDLARYYVQTFLPAYS